MTTEDTAGTDDVGTDQANDAIEGESDLRDAGKKALDEMKARLKDAKAKAKAFEEELSKLRGTTKDSEKPEDIRAQIASELRAEVLKERALDKLEVRAANKFADPDDARAFLASKVDEFVSDGKVSLSAIDEAISELLEKKPHLAASTKRFKEGVNSGPRNEGRLDQLTRADVERLAREGKHAEIVKAKADGRLEDLYKPN